MFFSCSSNPIIFPRHGKKDYQRVGELSEKFRTKFPSIGKNTKKWPAKRQFPPTLRVPPVPSPPKEMLAYCCSAILAHHILTVVLTDNVIFKALKNAKPDVHNKKHTGTSSSPRKAAQHNSAKTSSKENILLSNPSSLSIHIIDQTQWKGMNYWVMSHQCVDCTFNKNMDNDKMGYRSTFGFYQNNL